MANNYDWTDYSDHKKVVYLFPGDVTVCVNNPLWVSYDEDADEDLYVTEDDEYFTVSGKYLMRRTIPKEAREKDEITGWEDVFLGK